MTSSLFECVYLCVFWSSAAAVVIQQQWKKYRKKCGNISFPTTEQGRGYKEKTKSGCSFRNSTDGQNHAATIIQVNCQNLDI